jgi:uncharacterized protein DUF5694
MVAEARAGEAMRQHSSFPLRKKRGMRARMTRSGLVGALLAAGIGGFSASAARGAESTEVVILGTLHDMHQQNARYSLEILRDLIVKLKPAAILIELPPAIGGEPTVEKQRAAGRFGNNENWSANAAAEMLQIPVIPYDREGRNEYYRETKYFDRQTQLSRRVGDWLNATENRKAAPAETAILGPILGGTNRSQRYFSYNTGPEIINSEGVDRIVRMKHYMWDELMPQLSPNLPRLGDLAAEFAFFRDEWHQRNRIMADNIAAQARKWPARRIVVLCGYEHRYILRDLLSSQADIHLREFYEVMSYKP